MSKKEIDFDKELEKVARKSNINMRNTEYAFENQIKKLDSDRIAKQKIKDFDENKELASQYLSIDYKQDTIDRYREKLKKI